MQRLLETPKSEYRDKDDGFNEVEEANEAISFIERMSANDQGEPIPGTDPPLSKRDASLLAGAGIRTRTVRTSRVIDAKIAWNTVRAQTLSRRIQHIINNS